MSTAQQSFDRREPPPQLARGRRQIVCVVMCGVAERAPALDEVAGELLVAEKVRQAEVARPA